MPLKPYRHKVLRILLFQEHQCRWNMLLHPIASSTVFESPSVAQISGTPDPKTLLASCSIGGWSLDPLGHQRLLWRCWSLERTWQMVWTLNAWIIICSFTHWVIVWLQHLSPSHSSLGKVRCFFLLNRLFDSPESHLPELFGMDVSLKKLLQSLIAVDMGWNSFGSCCSFPCPPSALARPQPSRLLWATKAWVRQLRYIRLQQLNLN